jgi:Ricin-type beta-trefoil lectin domain/Lysozyme like domain
VTRLFLFPRVLLPAVATVALLTGAALALTAPASAASQARTASHVRTAADPSAPEVAGSRLTDSAVAQMSPAAQVAAAESCAAWATDAGFENNGYMGGGLATIVAIGLYESGCNAAACNDDTHIHVKCSEHDQPPGDAVDRGAFQLNSVSWRSISNKCAYSGSCAARAAYLDVSADDTYFATWSSYLDGKFAFVMWPAQQAVSALRQGSVTSALTGSCLGYPRDRTGARIELANCDTGTPQIWRLSGSTLRTLGGLCLTAASRTRTADVTLARCSRSSLEQWLPQTTGAELYNPGSRRCLADPVTGAGDSSPGIVLVTAACSPRQGEGWFKP